jgi:hypothetical protein
MWKTWRTFEENIHLKNEDRKSDNRFQLAQNMNQQRDLVNTAVNPRVPQKAIGVLTK